MSTLAPSSDQRRGIGAIRLPPAANERMQDVVRSRPRWWLEALTIAWLCWVYDAITNLAPLRLHAALDHASAVLSLEHSLHIGVEHSLDRWLSMHHTLGVIVSNYYDNAHFIVTLGLLGWLWWRRPDVYRPARTTLVLVNVLAFLVFWLYPVAPPRMLPGFVDVVASSHAIGSWHTGALASAANQLAAMPSLHIAWAVWCTGVIWWLSPRRWLRALALIYPFMTTFAVIATGNHFVLDVLGGLLAIAASALCVWALRIHAPRWRLPGRSRGLSRGRPGSPRTALAVADQAQGDLGDAMPDIPRSGSPHRPDGPGNDGDCALHAG